MESLESENMKNRIATENDVQKMDEKIKNILHNKIKNNFKNMETITSIDKSSTLPLPKDTIRPASETSTIPTPLQTSSLLNTEGFASTMQEEMEYKTENTKTKWKNAFHGLATMKVTDLQKPKGWKTLFETLFYLYPKITGIIVDDFIDGVPAHIDSNSNSEKEFYKNREYDKVTVKHTTHEFGYLLVALYFSHMLYARLYGTGHDLLSIEEYVKTGYQKIDKVMDILFSLVYSPCHMFHFLLFDGLEKLITMMGLDSYPTLQFIVIFVLCYHFAYTYLDKFVRMFLSVFDYKADASIYLFIIAGYIFFMISNSDKWYAVFRTSAFFVASIILLVISLILAPLSQLFFVCYSIYALAGSPSDWYKVAMSFFTSKEETVFDETRLQLGQSTMSSTESILGGFDFLSYKYAIKYLFFFLMLLFFLFKTIQSAIELKVLPIRTAVSSINAYITMTMLVIYIAKVLADQPNTKGKFVIGKKINKSDSVKESISARVQRELDTFAAVSPTEYNDNIRRNGEIRKQAEMLSGLENYLATLQSNIPNYEQETNNIMELMEKIKTNIGSLEQMATQIGELGIQSSP